MIAYHVTIAIGDEDAETDEFSSPDDVGEFISEQLHDNGEGSYTVTVDAFEEG